MAGLAISTCAAHAGGFEVLEQSASGLGNAYAGSAATADNASTIYYNPAGMTQLKDREISFGGALSSQSLQFSNQGSTAPANTNNINGGNIGGQRVSPNAYLSWRLTNQLNVGLGFGMPFRQQTRSEGVWAGSAQSNSFTIDSTNLNPSLAWKINDVISIGLGASWQVLKMEQQRQAGSATTVAPGIPGSTPISGNMSGESWGWNAGVLVTLTRATKLGVSYRSGIRQDMSGTMTGGSGSPMVNNAVGGDIGGGMETPDLVIASVTHRLNAQWELLGDVSWTGWSRTQRIDMNRTSDAPAANILPMQNQATDYRDTWRFALGGTYSYNEAVKLKMGVAYDQSPVKSAVTRTTWMPDNDRLWLTAGAQLRVTPKSTIDFGFAYIAMNEAAIDNDQTSTSGGRVRGAYEGSSWKMGLQYSMGF